MFVFETSSEIIMVGGPLEITFSSRSTSALHGLLGLSTVSGELKRGHFNGVCLLTQSLGLPQVLFNSFSLSALQKLLLHAMVMLLINSFSLTVNLWMVCLIN